MLIVGSTFIIFNLLFPYLIKDIKAIDSIPIGIETIIVLTFSFYYLYEKTNDTTTLYIYSTFSFWIVIGMVLYLAGSFFIYLFASSLSKQEVNKYWVVTNFLSFLKNVMFAVAITVNSKPTKKMPISDFELSSLN